MTTRLATILLLSLGTLLGGCGFHLRGADGVGSIPAELQPILLQGLPEFHDFQRILARQVNQAGIGLTERGSEARLVVVVRPPKPDRQVLSVDERSKTVEYVIRETLQFSARRGGEELLTDQQLTAERILFNPGTQLLGRTEEERLLRLDMYEELARRLLRHLGKVAP